MRRRPALAASLAALLLLGGGCAPTHEPDPLARVPALLVEGPALLRLLTHAGSLTATPAARLATRLRARLGDCAEVVGRFSDPSAAPPASVSSPLDALHCRDDRRERAAAEREGTSRDADVALAERLAHARGGHAGQLQWPIGRAGRIALTFDVDARGGLAFTGRLEPDEALGGAGFLIPSTTPPRPPVIDAGSALLHLHLRSASGTGLARLVPEESQGDRLFALKGRLLEGALLEGTLELALLEPAPDHEVPLAAVVLHHRGAAPITAALSEALEKLRRTWSIEPSVRTFATRRGEALAGGCYADLPLLPELAPCWVVADDVLVLGYRAEAVEAVLASPAAPAPAHPQTAARLPAVSAAALRPAVPDTPPPAPSDAREEREGGEQAGPAATRLVVDLDRMRALDHRLMVRATAAAGARSASPDAGAAMKRLADLYRRFELEAVADDEGIALSGALRARP